MGCTARVRFSVGTRRLLSTPQRQDQLWSLGGAKLNRGTNLPYLTLSYPTLPYPTLPYPTLPYLTSPHLALAIK
jgi:hypothetical protein